MPVWQRSVHSFLLLGGDCQTAAPVPAFGPGHYSLQFPKDCGRTAERLSVRIVSRRKIAMLWGGFGAGFCAGLQNPVFTGGKRGIVVDFGAGAAIMIL